MTMILMFSVWTTANWRRMGPRMGLGRETRLSTPQNGHPRQKPSVTSCPQVCSLLFPSHVTCANPVSTGNAVWLPYNLWFQLRYIFNQQIKIDRDKTDRQRGIPDETPRLNLFITATLYRSRQLSFSLLLSKLVDSATILFRAPSGSLLLTSVSRNSLIWFPSGASSLKLPQIFISKSPRRTSLSAGCVMSCPVAMAIKLLSKILRDNFIELLN